MELSTCSMILKRMPSGIIVMSVPVGWDQPDTLETAKENLVIMREITKETPCAFLIEPLVSYLSKEVIEFYSNAGLGTVATAMLTNSFASKVVGNLYLKIITTTITATNMKTEKYPVKLFSKREEAIQWLKDHIEAAKLA